MIKKVVLSDSDTESESDNSVDNKKKVTKVLIKSSESDFKYVQTIKHIKR